MNTLLILENLKKILCPPGNGVFTVNTAKERKDDLHRKLFQATGEKVQDIWEKNLENLKNNKSPFVLGIPSDCGGGILRGANWGPLFVRNQYQQSIQEEYFDLGDVRVIPHLLHDKYLNDSTLINCRKAMYGEDHTKLPVSPLSIAAEVVSSLFKLSPNARLFSIGGDHSVSYPLVKEFLKYKNSQNIKVGLIHFDAHTDLLVERLGIDICFGSWTYHILEDLQSPSLLHQIGIRSTGKPESFWEGQYGISQYWAKEVQEKGPTAIAETIIVSLKNEGVQELYISFDIDALDASYASATGTPETGGLAPDDAAIIIRKLREHFPITGSDLMEVAPFIHHPTIETKGNEPDMTLMVASSLMGLFLESMKQ